MKAYDGPPEYLCIEEFSHNNSVNIYAEMTAIRTA
jgi:hypothetical protein